MVLLLVGQKDAYMLPVQAVREGFDDIKAHQLAVVAGIQAALTRLLQRFDPDNLETRLEQSVLDNLWPANRKAKYWDLFTTEYQAIAHGKPRMISRSCLAMNSLVPTKTGCAFSGRSGVWHRLLAGVSMLGLNDGRHSPVNPALKRARCP
jgi:hypothetical protein